LLARQLSGRTPQVTEIQVLGSSFEVARVNGGDESFSAPQRSTASELIGRDIRLVCGWGVVLLGAELKAD
jgi:hypothetical protein